MKGIFTALILSLVLTSAAAHARTDYCTGYGSFRGTGYPSNYYVEVKATTDQDGKGEAWVYIRNPLWSGPYFYSYEPYYWNDYYYYGVGYNRYWGGNEVYIRVPNVRRTGGYLWAPGQFKMSVLDVLGMGSRGGVQLPINDYTARQLGVGAIGPVPFSANFALGYCQHD